MPKKPEINWWPSRKGYYAQIHGVQVRLATGPDDEDKSGNGNHGPTYLLAAKEFKEKLFGPKSKTVRMLCDEYEKALANEVTEETLMNVVENHKRICEDFGDRPYDWLTKKVLQDWIGAKIESGLWATTTARTVLQRLMACFRWAVDEEVIRSNPVPKVRLPPAQSRGKEFVVSPENEQLALASCRGATRDMVVFLRDTGCRPGELRKAEARHFDPVLRALVIPAASRTRGPTHKTGRHEGSKDRVIFLKGESLAIVQRQIERYPSGPIFRSPQKCRKGPHAGKRWAWNKQSIVSAFRRIRERTGITHLIAYSFRHTFAVRWIRSGKPALELTAVLGTSMRMIEKHYGHLADQLDYLRGLVDDERRSVPVDDEQVRFCRFCGKPV